MTGNGLVELKKFKKIGEHPKVCRKPVDNPVRRDAEAAQK
jgi:hypothetical protein